VSQRQIRSTRYSRSSGGAAAVDDLLTLPPYLTVPLDGVDAHPIRDGAARGSPS
jgi:hypothetical protein